MPSDLKAPRPTCGALSSLGGPCLMLDGHAWPPCLGRGPEGMTRGSRSPRTLRQPTRAPGPAAGQRQESPRPPPSPRSPWDAHLLYIRVGISIGENIRVLLPEDVSHSTAGDDFQAAPTHPHSEGDLCKTATTPRHRSASRAGGDTGWQLCGTRCQGTPKSEKGLRTGCAWPRVQG